MQLSPVFREDNRVVNIGYDPVTLVNRRIRKAILPIFIKKDFIKKITWLFLILNFLIDLPQNIQKLELCFKFFRTVMGMIKF
jgi:hypothetical protein